MSCSGIRDGTAPAAARGPARAGRQERWSYRQVGQQGRRCYTGRVRTPRNPTGARWSPRPAADRGRPAGEHRDCRPVVDSVRRPGRGDGRVVVDRDLDADLRQAQRSQTPPPPVGVDDFRFLTSVIGRTRRQVPRQVHGLPASAGWSGHRNRRGCETAPRPQLAGLVHIFGAPSDPGYGTERCRERGPCLTMSEHGGKASTVLRRTNDEPGSAGRARRTGMSGA